VFPTRKLALALLLTAATTTACTGKATPATPEARLAACAVPSASTSPAGQVDVEFRQGGKVIAQGNITAGGIFAAPVPASAAVDVYTDGKLLGTKQAGDSDVYLNGPGCPDTPN